MAWDIYSFLELVNFVKTEEEAGTDLDRRLYALKDMSSMDKVSVYFRKPVFEKLFNVAEYSNLTNVHNYCQVGYKKTTKRF